MEITCLLIANRGEIARRIARSARDMGIRTAAIYTAADAQAPFVADADDAVRLTGDSYLDGPAIIAAACRLGADAIHPGYGFLSENPEFAVAVVAAGLVWVGPPPEAIAAMGDKLAAKELAVRAGVPTLPMATDVGDPGEVGFPLLVKAAAGGGGKGMRVVESMDGFEEAIAACRREARTAFGDDRIFLERYVARSRHVEIQLLGDAHGNLVHLGERECSIQRRHQKIVEESPSPVVDSTMRAEMGDAAVRLGRALDYQSAGTVEFLVDDAPGADGRRPFWFLEVNTRIQVEHPVTEAVTGIDIVREQLLVAMGRPLGVTQAAVVTKGHAVEARLYAEDPATGFLPATGTLIDWQPDRPSGVRFDSGVEAGSVVGLQFDPMLAKVIAWAPTRAESIRKLCAALRATRIAGLTTNRDFLVSILATEAFRDGDTTTDFIGRVDLDPGAGLPEDVVDPAATAAAFYLQGRNRAESPVLRFMPSGWRNARLPAGRARLRHGGTTFEVAYRRRRDGSFDLADGRLATVFAWSPDDIDLEIDGRRLRFGVSVAGRQLYLHGPDGTIAFEDEPRFTLPGSEEPTGSLCAPMPGTVVALRIAPDERVAAGQTLLVLEAMKMEHHISAPADGIVRELLVDVGDQVKNGAALLVLEAPSD